MATQNILFTVMPRAMAVNTATLPISVFVSPRLIGDSALGAFADWVDWTHDLATHGLNLTIDCAGKTQTLAIDRRVLRPKLWRALFSRTTPVISYEPDDYTDHKVLSYPARAALSVLKAAYQDASLALALPDRPLPPYDPEIDPREYRASQARDTQANARRKNLRGLLDGLAINWNEATGNTWRDEMRALSARYAALAVSHPVSAAAFRESTLAPDGTFAIPPESKDDDDPGTRADAARALRSDLSRQFGVCAHMPQGDRLKDRPQNFDEIFDFHRALSSLASYPELLRALGIVFDLELPTAFVATTAPGTWKKLAVVAVPGREWAVSTTAPAHATAYLHWHVDEPSFRLFTAAPASLRDEQAPFDVFGLLMLDPGRHGVAQIDLESGMHKATLLAESWQPDRPNLAPADRPDVFDETTTLPSLRSGGFSLFADGRALRLASSFARQNTLQNGISTGSDPVLFAEDLTQGSRMDVWDAATGKWHSLHERLAQYDVNGEAFVPDDTCEGFAQLAAAKPSPGAPDSAMKDLYLNESIARWNGWSLSVPFPGKALSHETDPDKALDAAALASQNAAATPFMVGSKFSPAPASLPALRFGRRYRFRMRPVDLAGNSLRRDDPVGDALSIVAALPREPEGMPYLRFEPVDAPNVVLRDAAAVSGPGSQLDRLVIRTFNDSPANDARAAVLDAGDRHIVPPGISVEMAERLGMFDKDGKLDASPAMYALIAARDKGRLPIASLNVGGRTQDFPLVAAASLDSVPYLPDLLARGAAFRDLPGSAPFSVARTGPGTGADDAITYTPLTDANPRTGSATLIAFGDDGNGNGDGDGDGDGDEPASVWQQRQPFRVALSDGDAEPHWHAAERLLTISLTKGTSALVPMSSYMHVDDLKLMGVWQWLREAIDSDSISHREIAIADASQDSDKIAHILQRAQEGGHWMLNPPRMLTLVHAVQQPLGEPRFTAITVQHKPYGTPDSSPDDRVDPQPDVLQTVPESSPTSQTELAAITAWRHPNSTDAFLLGGLRIHAESTDRIELLAAWTDPIDDESHTPTVSGPATISFSVTADDVPISSTNSQYFIATSNQPMFRAVGYYDATHGLLCMVRTGDLLGNVRSGVRIRADAAPRHRIGDTRHHRVSYSARATSRFREYFDQNAKLDFTRTSQAVVVDVPASARPAPPQIDYIVPTFGWQRQTASNIKRSVRFGGGLRIYLDRPWFSSGEGELLGVTLFGSGVNPVDPVVVENWKSLVTQWGADPIWNTARLDGAPSQINLLNAVARESSLSLPQPAPNPGRVNVAGYGVAFDEARQKWFADIVIDTRTLGYTPFVRLVLARYQPCALPDAKLSAPVVADFIQLAPERTAVVSADPYHPHTLRVTVSGPAPDGPLPELTFNPLHQVSRPTVVTISVQQYDAAIGTDLGWRATPELATITPDARALDEVLRWSGSVVFKTLPQANRCRLMICEYEYVSANWSEDTLTPRHQRIREAPHRLIYAETVLVDAALVGTSA